MTGVQTCALPICDKVTCSVDYDHRRRVAPNHTMTHVLNWALREVLGDGVDQRGSLVNADRLRFDFASDGVKPKDLARVESLVQGVISAGRPVTSKEVSLADAQAINGLRAVAGEAYPDPVRVVSVGVEVPKLLAEPALNGGRLSVDPGNIVGHTVSCTGSQFCGLAMVETKANAEAVAKLLDERLVTPRPLRIHWTGCPNSCGQVQAADIGLMGGPAKKLDPESGKMKAVPGVSIFVGGRIGEEAHLSLDPYKKGVPMEDDVLLPELVAIAKEHFGATDK